ncbi:hypothetical protein BJ508DRAFT_16882 [Ascobolus immersus RN42]|uniref:Uncharacterized protein n=1 Tax=Ascobolus immersus RN42 TaxID=1160509 RepID=A0A3N4HQZ1_ASCIM|nr:hypothetical protein BJ508DRAFT_16882 [Ascobolus immersus RN42]
MEWEWIECIVIGWNDWISIWREHAVWLLLWTGRFRIQRRRFNTTASFLGYSLGNASFIRFRSHLQKISLQVLHSFFGLWTLFVGVVIILLIFFLFFLSWDKLGYRLQYQKLRLLQMTCSSTMAWGCCDLVAFILKAPIWLVLEGELRYTSACQASILAFPNDCTYSMHRAVVGSFYF